MPIENERKFLIDESGSSEQEFIGLSERTLRIEQKYVSVAKGFSTRIRRAVEGDGGPDHTLTVKKNIGGQVIEIETAIDEADFLKLWPTAFNRVVKTRYLYGGWEVDFFKDARHANYFAVAEIELPAWQREPRSIPDAIRSRLLFAVPPEDKRFSNRKLSNLVYAASLLRLIKCDDDRVPKKKMKCCT